MKRDDLRESFKTYMGQVDSPIELMLATALEYAIGFDMLERSGEGGLRPVTPICAVKTQVPLESYRVDIVLVGDSVKVAVECDGHEFHEKTKEQAAHDKARDRALVAAGYAVLRFTGAEIWRNPLGCAHEALSIASQQIADAQVAHFEATKDRSQP